MSYETEFVLYLDKFQRDVAAWASETFPGSTVEAKLRHLAKEVRELEAKAGRSDVARAAVAEECADIILILLHFAEAQTFSIADALLWKFEVCKRRRWGPPDAEGVVEHVREGDDG